MYIKTSDQARLNLGFNDYTCNWGMHIAGLYETEEERDFILINYLGEGARQKDIEMYCPIEQTEEEFIEKFTSHCPDCASSVYDPDIFQFYSGKEIYYPNGRFSPIEMDKGLTEFFINSQKNGDRNIRATTEMIWALEKIPGVEDLMAYESRLNYFIPGKPWISICLYNVTEFDGVTILNVLRTHPYTISKGILTENPFYIKPEKWLKENAPQFLEREL